MSVLEEKINRREMLKRLAVLGIGLTGLKLLTDPELFQLVSRAEENPEVAEILKESGDKQIIVSSNVTVDSKEPVVETKQQLLERIVSPDTKREKRIPPGQRETKDFPVLHYGQVQKIDPTKWEFKIFGEVDQEKTLSFDEFMNLPRVNVFSDIHCVTTWSRLDNIWEGVSTSVIKDLVKISPKAKFVLVHAAGGFTTNLPVEEFFKKDVLFTLKHNNEDITPSHGWPVRLVVPQLYFWKSAKWVTGIEFMEQDKDGFWESNGYHHNGNPWIEERYSVR